MKISFFSKMSKSKWIELLLGLLCTIIVLATEFYNIPIITDYIKKLDYQIYDQVVTWNLNPHNHTPKVVIIDIDETSIAKEGRWPWPRDKMAKLITILKQDGVVTIGMDVVMPEAEINYAEGLRQKILQLSPIPSVENTNLASSLSKIAPEFDNDQIFARTLTDHNVVLGFLFHNDPSQIKGTLPAPLNYMISNSTPLSKLAIFPFLGYIGSLDMLIQASTKGGFVTNFPDSDGVVRRTLLLATYKGKLYPSLALATAMNYLLVDKVKLMVNQNKLYGVQLDGTFIPTNEHAQSLIPFWGPAQTLDFYTASDLLEGKVDPKELQGTIAIVGSSITLLADLHDSPVAPSFPGVEMVGNIVQGIVTQESTSEYNWNTLQGFLIVTSIGIVFALLLPFLEIIIKILIGLISLVCIMAVSFYLYKYHGIYLPTSFLLILIGLQSSINFGYAFIVERLQKRKISQLFGQYVPEDYVKELIEFPDKYSMEGQTRNMTVLFVDIRSFTSISETLDAANVKHLLNTFFTPLTEIIFSHRGTIDKYVGDMVVAFWGAPMEDKEHAHNAIITTLSIMKQLPEINLKMNEQNLPAVNIGIGLATGLMNVGDMGSEFRRAYTVLGDIVNLGSRLQDLTKFYKVNILVSNSTREGQEDIIWRAIDKVSVKGRKTALLIYNPICTKEEASPELLNELNEYDDALKDYFAQNWSSAEKSFCKLQTAHPDVYVYQLYLERIANFKKKAPPKDWDGVYVHDHK